MESVMMFVTFAQLIIGILFVAKALSNWHHWG